MTAHPAALQLRLLQTVVEVAAEKNSTLVLPFPVELLRFLERATPTATGTASGGPTATSAADDGQDGGLRVVASDRAPDESVADDAALPATTPGR
jgi:hypothetical protein